MKQPVRQTILLCLSTLLIFLAGCTTVPITGRSQFNTVPDSLINSMALQEYNSFLKSPENKISTDAEKTAMVQRVGGRIADAVQRYMNEHGLADQIADYEWEFNLIDSDQKNAWAMPGGKVVVYTGILETTQNEAGLAVVMAHEIAHAIARHGAERMTQGLAVTLGGVALNEAIKDEPSATRTIFLTSYGVGTTVAVMLPYSRMHETEADRLGLIFMAMAGYPPEEAVGFWQRMAQSKDGSAPPEFLSTHPADETRIMDIKRNLPEARRYYRPYKPVIEPPR
ncbi:MAG: peptidase M48 [Planctomycetales bacterium 4572_13]|nr:MAG: peptidase M48 [Planctomycetales bacterium 4572_13]